LLYKHSHADVSLGMRQRLILFAHLNPHLINTL